MPHKAFEVIGERILLDVSWSGRRTRKLGIFQESEEFDTIAEGKERPALDFIETMYETSSGIEEFAKGLDPRERINLDNPILNIHCGMDHTLLKYEGKEKGAHKFTGVLWYVQGVFYNDGNFEVYDKYKESLRKAAFKIK